MSAAPVGVDRENKHKNGVHNFSSSPTSGRNFQENSEALRRAATCLVNSGTKFVKVVSHSRRRPGVSKLSRSSPMENFDALRRAAAGLVISSTC
ncbi:hypothetical protein Y032_0755g2078 [Ancylostoma ceylanicum]|uniref:Uncharacterized protein n=1 Tax=Ancylostoma ceylanicum TaxID=53326 RepID=A0A016WE81_9BILA|nr:hypothetical protein Y032_0755g2078 [Ancylostoma ceylanicum]